MLVQANSGGGKSWLLRRLLEQSQGKVQQIVIDLEGEFSTLREKYDYVLAGKGGDTSADPRSAGMLAKKLLELKASAIIDLYELNQYDRKRFVKVFLDAMVNAPKELWHPVLVVIDEAHVFCPEKGSAESSDAVIDMATRGRKRGFCVCLATQRLSKLHKDAAAECNNKLIGRTGLDVDMKRASEELGFTSKEQYLSLRKLEAGEFFAFGPAISNDVEKVKVGPVETTHPKAGSRILTQVTPPTKKIKALLKELEDLPEQAHQELKTMEEKDAEITRLRRELTISKKNGHVDESAIKKAVEDTEKRLRSEFSVEQKNSIKEISEMQNVFEQVGRIISPFAQIKVKTKGHSASPLVFNPPPMTPEVMKAVKEANTIHVPSSAINTPPGTELGKCAATIYSFLYSYPDRTFSKIQIGAATKYSPRSGGFNNALSQLRQLGLITEGVDIQIARVEPELAKYASQDFSIDGWLNNLGKCPREIYQFLLNNPNESFSKDFIGESTGYSAGSGGFNNAISKLNSTGLIIRQGGMIRLNPELLDL